LACQNSAIRKVSFSPSDEVLFAYYDAPDESQRPLFAAFNEIKEQIETEGVVMADIKRNDDIVKFAAA
jgi:hypothetical protein